MIDDYSAYRARIQRGYPGYPAPAMTKEQLNEPWRLKMDLVHKITDRIKLINYTNRDKYEITYSVPVEFQKDIIGYFTSPMMGYEVEKINEEEFIFRW